MASRLDKPMLAMVLLTKSSRCCYQTPSSVHGLIALLDSNVGTSAQNFSRCPDLRLLVTATAFCVITACWLVGIATRLHHICCIATHHCKKPQSRQHPHSRLPCHSTHCCLHTAHSSPQCKELCMPLGWTQSGCLVIEWSPSQSQAR